MRTKIIPHNCTVFVCFFGLLLNFQGFCAGGGANDYKILNYRISFLIYTTTLHM